MAKHLRSGDAACLATLELQGTTRTSELPSLGWQLQKKSQKSQALPGNTPCPMCRGLKIWGLKILCGNVHKGAQRTRLEGQCHAHVTGFLPPAFPGLPKSCASPGLHPAPSCWGPTGLAQEQGALRNRAARAGSSVCKSKKEKAAHCKLLLCKKNKK